MHCPQHKEQIVNDIGFCPTCDRIVKYNSYDQDVNIKPVVLKEGHPRGIEYVRSPEGIEIYYEGKHWATMSVADEDLQHITDRMIQSIAKCYLREGSLVGGRSLREQVQMFLNQKMPDDQIIGQFPKDKRDTVRRYVRDLSKVRVIAHRKRSRSPWSKNERAAERK